MKFWADSGARGLAAIMLSLGLSACAYVEVERVDGTRETHWQVGLVSIDPPAAAEARLVQVTGVGVVRTPEDFTIGYVDADYAFLDDSCRLVLWVESDTQLRSAKKLLGQTDNLCLLKQD